MSESKNFIPVLSEFKSGLAGGFVTDMSQVRGGAELSANAIQKVDFNKAQNKILFYNSRAEGATPVASIDVSSFVSGGLLKAVTLNDSILSMTFSLTGGDQTVEIPLESLFSPDNYYSKTDIDGKLLITPLLQFDSFNLDIFEDIFIEEELTPEWGDIKSVTYYKGSFYIYKIATDDAGLNYLYLNNTSPRLNYYQNPNRVPFENKVYASNGALYFYDPEGSRLMPLSISGIRHICKNNENEDEGNTDLSGLIDRLEALEEHNFPISISPSFLPGSGSFDGTPKSVTVNATFKKGNDNYTPAKVAIYRKINGNFSVIYENLAPTTNAVKYDVSGITSTSTSFKIDITTAEGVVKSVEKIFYIYLPLYVGFAPTNTDFSDINTAAVDKAFTKVYSSAFTKNISMTTTEDGCDIFVLVPENKTLNGFTYSSSNLTVPFDKLEGTFKYKTDLGDFKYNVYRSSNTNGGMMAGNTYDKINITL